MEYANLIESPTLHHDQRQIGWFELGLIFKTRRSEILHHCNERNSIEKLRLRMSPEEEASANYKQTA